jgi:hypothetical protein
MEPKPAMSAISAASANQISPVNERLYHQSNLLGDWKGSWKNNGQPVELKVVSIQGNSAQVEYTHNGRTERGAATVSQNLITFGNVTIGTRDGKNAALVFSYGTAKQDAILTKAASTTSQNKLVGTWIGTTATQSATFKVLSITGRDAQVQYTINGQTRQGVGDVYQNVVTFGKVQVSSNDGVHATIVFPSGHSTLSVAATKFTPPTATSNSTSSVVNKIA